MHILVLYHIHLVVWYYYYYYLLSFVCIYIYLCKCIFRYISFGVSKVVDKSRGKLEVAPCFLPTALAGPYWVLDYSEEEGYALISGGGPPDFFRRKKNCKGLLVETSETCL